jgi:hypothetical protein
MNTPIITPEMIQQKARADHARGVKVCPLPTQSAAAKTWREEVARLLAEEVAA